MKMNSSINIRINKEIREKFLDKCKKDGTKYSKLVREFIDKYIEGDNKWHKN